MESNTPENSKYQYTISYELLILIQWLLDYDLPKLKKIIKKAVASGLYDDMNQFKHLSDQLHDPAVAQEMQFLLIEFFSLCETMLYEAMSEYSMEQAKQKETMPAIEHIDAMQCDSTVVASSVERAHHFSKKNNKYSPQEIMFRELLRRWKPMKKSAIN